MGDVNDGIRFLLELGVLAALVYWGWRATRRLLRWLLAAVPAIAVAVVWATWVAAASGSVLADPWRLLLEAAIFGVGAAALAATRRLRLAAAFAAVAVVHLGLTFALDQRDSMRTTLRGDAAVPYAVLTDSRY